MHHSGSDASATLRDGESKKRDHEGKRVNGVHDDPSVNGAAGPSLEQYSQLPPEIAHISAEAYNPLSTLIVRLSQECYNDLGDALQKMADIPLAQQTNGVLPNGLGPHGAANGQENAKANAQKKMLLMKFAQENRAKFIKLLVLTEWGKKAAVDVSKLIDLYTWTKEQDVHMQAADFAIDSIKRHASIAKENNPDITTALEILSTGKASWMPSLDYIPPDPISSEQALKLLRYMNTSLSIRLNLHETLPRHLRNWRIESGRATFIVDGQFEFDVISFVEDASEQWLFIDLRLLFSPAPVITVGSRFFMHLKAQADHILQEKGLSGLFDFLNNFVLTHKISVLRSQALGLARTGWAGSLKVEPVHRELVVQYWTGRPGKKNWIEIGISKNKPKNGKVSWRGLPVPSLTARWFRQGKEVKDADLKFDWKDLSTERIIKRVIARHTSDILRSTRGALNPSVTAHASLSDTEPTDCALKASLGTRANSMAVSLEPVTGNYILQPATALSTRAENAFNQGREPVQMGNILTQLLAETLLTSIRRYAQQLGWQPVARQSLHFQVVKTAVKLDMLQFALYWPRGWSSSWAFAAIVDSSGESWWVLEIGSNGGTIEHAEQIKLDRPDGRLLPIDRNTLASLERVAVQLLSFRVTARQLEKEKKSCILRCEFGPTSASAAAQRIARRWVLYLQTPDVLVTKPGEEPWLESNIAITCEGLKAESQNVWHIATGRMVKSAAADMQKLMAASPQSNFSFSEDGRFRILLSTPFGQDILGELRVRLRDVNHLRSFATTLQKRQMRLGSSSLQRVQFEYGPSPYTAAVNFGAEKEISVELSPNNPHYRVHRLLTEIANDRSPFLPSVDFGDANGLDRFCTALILTRSLLKIMSEIQVRTPGNVRNPAIHVHSIFKYRLTYENPVCTFDVRLQPKDDKVYWFIEDCLKARSMDTRPTSERGQYHRRLDNLVTKLKELFSGKGPGWFGTRNGMIAELDGVPDALRRLDACVLGCKMEGGYKAPPPLEQPAPQGQPNGTQQQANQPARMQQQGRPQQQPQPGPGQVRKQQQNQRPQPNGRQPPQQGRGGGRPGQSKQNVIEID
ncbi:MED14-domain-containing protein [Cucurbitaria berberidis CBS 394.84]|uniref:Mediator of RNA polymerase II transcription subunit 14 n=1 Tax=Cucurbitaria berberidis CBS 394.84 TaxID=1168544 RepID=A0A9P4GER4_9PLEO|nr:MED14-domain-containing protein [Cucurbitaria berberidis CBS 394.84]KAF1843894.1 MED14-domain-containing protein [Cucurbitaria berberidis CBS 394.84]